MTIAMDLEIEAAQTDGAILKVTGINGLIGSASVVFYCGTGLYTVTLTTSPLADEVWRHQPLYLHWSVQVGPAGTFQPIGQTAHTLFVTYATPIFDNPVDDPPTPMRLQTLIGWAIERAKFGLNDALQLTNAIHYYLGRDGEPPFTPEDPGVNPPWIDDWWLMSGTPYAGECDELARFMNRSITLLGLPPGTPNFIHASTDGNPLDEETTTAAALGITTDLDGDGTPGETDEVLKLIFDFDPPPEAARNWNFFEGVLVVSGKWYAVWPSHVADSACGIFEFLSLPESPGGGGGEGAQQFWVYWVPGRPFYWHPTPVPMAVCYS